MSKVASKRVVKKVEPEPIPVPVHEQESVPEPVVEAKSEVEEVKDAFKEKMNNLTESLNTTLSQTKENLVILKKLQKDFELLLKKKKLKGQKTRDFTKRNVASGFAGPVIVSDELYDFLIKTNAVMKDQTYVPSSQEEYDNWRKIPVKRGEPVARTDVTSHLSKYIKEHNLQNPQERREIVLDDNLKVIFSEPMEVSKSDPNKKVYTYLRLQKYISHHFPKREKN